MSAFLGKMTAKDGDDFGEVWGGEVRKMRGGTGSTGGNGTAGGHVNRKRLWTAPKKETGKKNGPIKKEVMRNKGV